jgi:enamine deaminase RidA (YjgF/YER057c/UK114 family)
MALKEAGMSVDDLVYVEIYCTDLKLCSTFNKVYASAIKSPYPAHDFIGVKDLIIWCTLRGYGYRRSERIAQQKTAARG